MKNDEKDVGKKNDEISLEYSAVQKKKEKRKFFGCSFNNFLHKYRENLIFG